MIKFGGLISGGKAQDIKCCLLVQSGLSITYYRHNLCYIYVYIIIVIIRYRYSQTNKHKGEITINTLFKRHSTFNKKSVLYCTII